MAGIRLPPEESELSQQQQQQQQSRAAGDLVSDDERSVAADSWSIKSDYGSTLDDDQRHADAAEALSSANFRASSDYNSDKEELDAEGVSSLLGLQSYWDSAYADELANFREHGHAGEVWFGANVMDVVASWTKSLCIDISQGHIPNHVDDNKSEPEPVGDNNKYLSHWSVLDIGTGNGLLLQELAKQGVLKATSIAWSQKKVSSLEAKTEEEGWNTYNILKLFSDLTGVDYSEGAIDLAQNLANRDGFSNIKFLVDDVLDTKLERQFQLVMDKGTLDAIGLHPDGPLKRILYWNSVSKLVASGGLLVITSCNNTKDELVQEVLNLNQRRIDLHQEPDSSKDQEESRDIPFRYFNHVRTYPTFMFGGSEGSRVATVAFIRN
ncbi:hypothetical protein EZV62_004940 [Acer yangbiense]|uniref:Protein-lysine N-methyltransferase EZV62_004940 n=1 Tax=Acer yangbiense TaxID=1000413 RepID=A0A5C7ILE5_9ROSI|nr:hypothetical protein EZV62_004940 [Acer yangbiense]